MSLPTDLLPPTPQTDCLPLAKPLALMMFTVGGGGCSSPRVASVTRGTARGCFCCATPSGFTALTSEHRMSGAATCTYDLCGPPPPDPSSHDPIVHTVAELADHLSRAANESQPISLRISGVIPLGSLPPTGEAPTLLPWIEAGANRDSTRPPSVTLWGERDDGLDADVLDARVHENKRRC